MVRPRRRIWEILTVFKSGYAPRGVLNYRHSNAWVRVSEWDGHTLELTPFRGAPKDRSLLLGLLIIQCRHHATPLKALHDEVLKDVDSAEWPKMLKSDADQLLRDQ